MQKGVHDAQLWKYWKLGRHGWQHIKVRQQQVGIAPTSLFSHPISLHPPPINHKVNPFESFTLSPFEKMLGGWYPEFVQIHVFLRIHETTNNNQEDLKHYICFIFHPFNFLSIQKHPTWDLFWKALRLSESRLPSSCIDTSCFKNVQK